MKRVGHLTIEARCPHAMLWTCMLRDGRPQNGARHPPCRSLNPHVVPCCLLSNSGNRVSYSPHLPHVPRRHGSGLPWHKLAIGRYGGLSSLPFIAVMQLRESNVAPEALGWWHDWHA